MAGLEELEICGSDIITLPLSAEIPDAAPALLLPQLKQLNLQAVAISESAIHRLLAGCTVLKGLDLDDICGVSTVWIISPTLRSISVSGPSCTYVDVDPAELVIEDAPCLERLLHCGCMHGPSTIRVMTAPKLNVLSYISYYIPKLVLGTIIIQL